jgi:hypothetical protein
VKSVARYDIIACALVRLGRERSVWQKPGEKERDVVERLRERLTVDRVAALQDPKSPRGEGALPGFAAEIAAGDTGLTSLKSNLNKRRSYLITQLSGLSPSTPLRAGAEQELRVIENELERASSKVIQQTSAQILERFNADLRRTQMVEGNCKPRRTRSAGRPATSPPNCAMLPNWGSNWNRFADV